MTNNYQYPTASDLAEEDFSEFLHDLNRKDRFLTPFTGVMQCRPHYTNKHYANGKRQDLYRMDHRLDAECVITDYPQNYDFWNYCCMFTKRKFTPDSPEQFQNALSMYFGCDVELVRVVAFIRPSGHHCIEFHINFLTLPNEQETYDAFRNERHSETFQAEKDRFDQLLRTVRNFEIIARDEKSTREKIAKLQKELDFLTKSYDEMKPDFEKAYETYQADITKQEFKFPILNEL